MLAFLYRARRKYHLGLGADGIERMPLVRAIDAVSGLGLGAGAVGPQGERAWVRHAGLQGPAPRSMTSLLALLADRFGQRFIGQQFIGGWHPVERGERARLGGMVGPAAGIRLGLNGVLGSRVWDQTSAIQITSAPLRLPAMRPFLPGGDAYSLLGWMVRRHLQSDVDVRLRLVLDPDESGAALLGGASPPSLGHTSWLTTATVGPTKRVALVAPMVRLRAARIAADAVQPSMEISPNGH